MGGEYLSSCGGTSPGCSTVVIVVVSVFIVVDATVEWDVATSSVGRKSGTNFALEEKAKRNFFFLLSLLNDKSEILILAVYDDDDDDGGGGKKGDFQFKWVGTVKCTWTFNKYQV